MSEHNNKQIVDHQSTAHNVQQQALNSNKLSDVAGSANYNSNPFTLGFDGMSRMFKYAQGVTIAIIVFGLLSFVGNMFSNIGSFNSDNYNNSIEEQFENGLEDGSELRSDVLGISTAANTQEDNISVVLIAGGFLFLLVLVLVIVIVAGPLFGAVFKGTVAAAGNAAAEGRNISFGEALAVMGNHFGGLYVGELVSTLKIIGGYFLFIIPGVRAQFRYQFLPNVIIRENLSGTKGIARCKELASGHLMELFGIQTAASAIPVVGPVMSAGANALSYHQIDYLVNNNLPNPKVHWLNYLGFIIFGVIFVGVIVLALLLIAIFTSLN